MIPVLYLNHILSFIVFKHLENATGDFMSQRVKTPDRTNKCTKAKILTYLKKKVNVCMYIASLQMLARYHSAAADGETQLRSEIQSAKISTHIFIHII